MRMSDDAVKRSADKRRGKKRTPEQIANIKMGIAGKFTAEVRAKMSASAKTRPPRSDESIEKSRIAGRKNTKPKSPEHRHAIAVALRRRFVESMRYPTDME